MVINHTRFADMDCWRKVFNKYHRRFASGFNMSRTDGVAYHAGVAHGLATGDWESANHMARISFDKEIEAANLLPAEQYAVEDNWEVTELMLKLYKDNYEQEDIRIIQPECEFNVPLTSEWHYCIWNHWMDKETGEEHWTPPSPEMILARRVMSPHDIKGGWESSEARKAKLRYCPCYGPHRLVGKIDGIYSWKGALWINDHKTTSLYPSAFWAQWSLNYQPLLYMYGAEKALGVRPNGFIINAIFKPSEAQVVAWNAKRKNGPPQAPKDYLKYGREARAPTDEDVARAVRDVTSRADEWEWRILNGNFPLSPPPQQACIKYNKTCEFMPLCTSHDEEATLSGYQERPELDYVERELFQIQGVSK